ncbi:unnamed protein product [Urochloa humidicola]
MFPQVTWILTSHITLIFLSTAWAATNQTINTDHQALLCIKSQLSQPNSTGALATWSNGSLDFCQWQGVSCSWRHGPNPRVTTCWNHHGSIAHAHERERELKHTTMASERTNTRFPATNAAAALTACILAIVSLLHSAQTYTQGYMA